jgi:hypothetical protein
LAPSLYLCGLGEDFRKQYAIHYPDADTPVVTFASVIWAKDYLPKNESSRLDASRSSAAAYPFEDDWTPANFAKDEISRREVNFGLVSLHQAHISRNHYRKYA